MAAIYEALSRLRNTEAQRQQSLDFLRPLSQAQAENVHALLLILKDINQKSRQQNLGVRFSLVGKKVLDKWGKARTDFDFLIVNNAGEDTNLRERAVGFLIGELGSVSGLETIYQPDGSDAFNRPEARVMEINCGDQPLRFYVMGKIRDDSYTIRAASDVNDQWSALLNPPPVTFSSF